MRRISSLLTVYLPQLPVILVNLVWSCCLPPLSHLKPLRLHEKEKGDVLNSFSCWHSLAGLGRPCAASRGSFGQVCWALASPSAVWCLLSRGWDDGGQSLGPSLTHVFQKLLVFGAYTRVISQPEYLDGSDGPGGVFYHLSVLGERALHFAPRDANDKGRIYCEPGSLS